MLLSFSYEIPSLGFLRQFYGYVLIMARGFVDLVPVFLFFLQCSCSIQVSLYGQYGQEKQLQLPITLSTYIS